MKRLGFRQTRVRAGTLAVTFLLTSCGGGGNDGGSQITPPAAPPQPVLNASNAETIGTLVIASAEAILMFADEAALALRKFDDATLYQHPDNCNSGAARYLLTDNDQDGGLSVGDVVRTDYSRCMTPSTDGILFGDLFVTLEEIDTNRGTDEVRYVATVDASAASLLNSGSLVTTDGLISIEFQRGTFESHLSVAGDVDVTFTFPSSGASVAADWQAMDVSKREFYESAGYELSMAGTWRSNILEGQVAIETVEPLAGPLNTWPTGGQVELAGDDGSVVKIQTDGLGPGDFAIFSVDEDGDGTFADLDETRDWQTITAGYLWWFELSSPFEYGIRSYDPNDFRILTWRPHDRGNFGVEPTSVNPTIRILTSQVIDPDSVPDGLRLVSIQSDWPFLDILVDVDVEVRDAMLLIRPLQQLALGAPYRFPEQPIQISDMNGNTAWISGSDSRIRVVDELVAATTPEESYGFPGGQVTLGSADSFAESGNINQFDWSQVLGSPGQIAGADQSAATLTLPATTQTELLRVHLQITNDYGEFDFAKTDITLFPSVDEIDLVHVRARTTASEWREWLLTPANGDQQYSQNNINQISVTHDTDYVNPELSIAFRQNWQINIESPTGTQLGTGVYDDITSVTANANEPGLSVSGDPDCLLESAWFEVLEFTTDATGQPDTIAVDFVTNCASPGELELVEGFVRLRSSIPIPPPSP